MTDKPLVIPIDKIKSDFQTFLAPDHNRRIIFSGPFGIGKTYFLNEFFNEKEEYSSIFLRPINYSLLSNEDVFKFIKYDILAQLIAKKKIDIDKEIEIPTSENLKSFLKNNKLLVLKNLLKIIPKLGGFSDSIDAVEELYLEYRKAKENLSTELSAEQIKIFNDDFEDHFLSEFDNVSEIIKQKIEEENKQCVLVIDDLDRLDPEHIFRLFNVFSAHFDQVHYYENEEGNDNKFGFDKIIFVCDIENIRKIFAHRYGNEVDFSGYIDKFYSTEIYKFLHAKIFEESIYPFVAQRLKKVSIGQNRYPFVREFCLILSILFDSNQLNIRDINRISIFQSTILESDNNIKEVILPLKKFGGEENSPVSEYFFLVIYKMMNDLLGSELTFLNRLKSAQRNLSYNIPFDQHLYNDLIHDLVLFSDIQTHMFKNVYNERNSQGPSERKEIEYNVDGINISFTYSISAGYISRLTRRGPVWYRADIEGKEPIIGINEFMQMLIRSVENIINLSLLK